MDLFLTSILNDATLGGTYPKPQNPKTPKPLYDNLVPIVKKSYNLNYGLISHQHLKRCYSRWYLPKTP